VSSDLWLVLIQDEKLKVNDSVCRSVDCHEAAPEAERVIDLTMSDSVLF
jgi:hypothetical protein